MNAMLVTGGCGFIGSNFILSMRARDPECFIVNLDALTYAGNPDNLRAVESDKKYVFVKGSVCDDGLIDQLFERYGFDAVVHFAAETHVDRSITGPAIFTQTNVVGTQTLLESARRRWGERGESKRFVAVSTDEVYGSLGPAGYFTEETPLAPNSPYAASKAGADLIARAYFHTYGFPSIITRCSNNYGGYQFPEKLIPLMIINALAGKALPVYGDGKNVRDWLFVEDHCSALAAVLERGACGEVYNIGGNNEKRNIDIVKLILDGLGKPDRLISFVKDRPGHDRRYAIDASKIKRELGWQPSVTFERGIEKTIRWYLDNRAWWEKLVRSEKSGLRSEKREVRI